MNSSSRDYTAFVSALLGIVATALAWFFPNVPIEYRIIAIILSLVLLLFVNDRSQYQGFRQRISALFAFVTANYALALASVSSILFLLLFPYQLGSELETRANLVVLGILTASLSGLIVRSYRMPSVRILKASSDRVYLVEDGIKRHIPDPLTRDFIMLDTGHSIERVSDLELRLYPELQPLPAISQCRLVKGSGPAQFVIWENRRKQMPNEQTIQYFFPNKPYEEIEDVALESYPRTGALPSMMVVGLRSGGSDIPAASSPSRAENEDKLTIVSGRWGANNGWLDVTEVLRGKIKNGKLQIRATNSEFGPDPAPGVVKKLEVTYSQAGLTKFIQLSESEMLSLPEFSSAISKK